MFQFIAIDPFYLATTRISGRQRFRGRQFSQSRLPTVFVDLDIVSRPQGIGFDIGAYEFGYTGDPEINSFLPISIYPNPATENLIVKLRSGSLNTKCLMYDLHGRKVDEKLLIDGYTVFNTSKLASGIYFIHIRTGESDVVRKVVITQSN